MIWALSCEGWVGVGCYYMGEIGGSSSIISSIIIIRIVVYLNNLIDRKVTKFKPLSFNYNIIIIHWVTNFRPK